jgi:hypothetical protein
MYCLFYSLHIRYPGVLNLVLFHSLAQKSPFHYFYFTMESVSKNCEEMIDWTRRPRQGGACGKRSGPRLGAARPLR